MINGYVICTLFAVGLGLVSCGDIVPISPNTRLVSLGDDQDTTCSSIFSCLDCKTARLCQPDGKGGFNQIQTIPCPESSPFCNYNTGTCTTEPNPTCGQKDDAFICLEDGNFPDPDCHFYHSCSGLKASKFQCIIEGETYNAKSGRCEKSATCGQFSCSEPGQKVAHTETPNYYAYCKDAKSTALVDRCQGNYELNVTSQACEPICHVEGVQQDLQDCTKYFKCHMVWLDEKTSLMMKDKMDCPPNTGFDPSNYICVSLPSVNLPNCPPKV